MCKNIDLFVLILYNLEQINKKIMLFYEKV